MLPYKILIVDDEKLIRWSLTQALGKEGYQVLAAEDGDQGLAMVGEEDPDLVILDVKLPGIDGLQVLEKIREFNAEVVVIMLTAFDALEIAVQSMKLGAYDYIHKPYELDKVKVCIKNALETVKLKKEVQQLQEEQSSRYGFKNIIGKAENMRQVFEMVRLVARSDGTAARRKRHRQGPDCQGHSLPELPAGPPFHGDRLHFTSGISGRKRALWT